MSVTTGEQSGVAGVAGQDVILLMGLDIDLGWCWRERGFVQKPGWVEGWCLDEMWWLFIHNWVVMRRYEWKRLGVMKESCNLR